MIKYESLEKEVVQGCTPGNRSHGWQRRCWTVEWTGLTTEEAAEFFNASLGGQHWTTTTMTTTIMPATCATDLIVTCFQGRP